MCVHKYKIYAEYKAEHQNINRGNYNFLETLYFKNCLHYTCYFCNRKKYLYGGTKAKDNQHRWKKEQGGELALPRLVIVC